jgi:N-acyl-D-amino-acid deacylase
MHDLAITGGTVHDGLGSPGLRADVAIDADRVVAIDRDIGRARRTTGVVLRAGASESRMP